MVVKSGVCKFNCFIYSKVIFEGLMKKFWALVFFMFSMGCAMAQDFSLITNTKYGFGFTRFGFGFHYEHPVLKRSSFFKGYHINTELGNLMNPAEIAIINPNLSGQRGVYKFEKIAHAWSIKPLFGKTILLGNLDASGVIPVLKVSLGPSVSYVWPVYINYLTLDSFSQNSQLKEVKYNPAIHSQELIAEKASFTNDLSQGNLRLGLAARFGFDFNVINSSGGSRSVGVGARFEYYPQKTLSIYFDETLNRQMYSSFYINFALSN